MTVQRILLLIAAVAAVALVFGLPRIFEETNEAAVPPVQLQEEPTDRRADPPPRRERERPRRTPTPTPEATAPPAPVPPPAPAAPPPATGDDDDDDDGGED
jgi:hypothetical protein